MNPFPRTEVGLSPTVVVETPSGTPGGERTDLHLEGNHSSPGTSAAETPNPQPQKVQQQCHPTRLGLKKRKRNKDLSEEGRELERERIKIRKAKNEWIRDGKDPSGAPQRPQKGTAEIGEGVTTKRGLRILSRNFRGYTTSEQGDTNGLQKKACRPCRNSLEGENR